MVERLAVHPTAIGGVVVVEGSVDPDERGSFFRTFDARVLDAAGIDLTVLQASTSVNDRRGTLRGLHYQDPPASEPKLVHCTRGRIFDVAVDLRPGSPTYTRWVGTELEPNAPIGVFVPPGCAHGFLTLEDHTNVSYLIGAEYDPAVARGVRWDDPAFGIEWPYPPVVMSQRDAEHPRFIP